MKTLKEQKWMLVVYAVIFIAIGLLELILSIVNLGAAIRVVSYAIATGLFIVGIMHIVASLVAETKTFFKIALVIGSIAIAAGVVLCINPFLMADFLIKFVAVLAIALGVVLIVKAILAIVYKYKGGWIFFYFLFATIFITFGILILVFEKRSETQIAIYASTGAFILILGIFLLVAGIKVLTKKSDVVDQ